MDARHARQHLDELHGAAVWLRSSAPEHPRYRLWLGDLIEFTRAAYGLESAEMTAVRDVLRAEPRPRADAPEGVRVQAHLARLNRFIALIDRFAAALPEEIPLTEIERRDPHRNGTRDDSSQDNA